MKSTRYVVIATAALLALSAAGSLRAAMVNVLLGVPFTAEYNFTDFAGNTDSNVFTDGNIGGNGPYGYYVGDQSWVSFDLGTPTTVNVLGIADTDASRRVPMFVQLDFSNDNFGTLVATRTVNLADLSYQQAGFSGVTAQFVKFVFPQGLSNCWPTRPDVSFTRINELELYLVPEPSTILLLGLGGCLAWWRRRQHAA